MAASAISDVFMNVIKRLLPCVDANGDGFEDSVQVAHVEGVKDNTGAMLEILNTSGAVDVNVVTPSRIPIDCAVSASQNLGASAGIGDILESIWIMPQTTTPGVVTYQEIGGTAHEIFKAGTYADLKPFLWAPPTGLISLVAGWQVTCGAAVKAHATGRFSNTALPTLADTYLGGEGKATSTALTAFSDRDIGQPDNRRWVTIAATSSSGVNCTHSTITATKYDNAGNPSGVVTFAKVANSEISTAPGVAESPDISWWEASVPTGTKIGVPQFTCSAAPGRVHLAYYVHGRGAALAVPAPLLQAAGTADSLSGTINVVANGLILGQSVTNTGTDVGTNNWTGLTETYDEQAVSTTNVSGGMYANPLGSLETARPIASNWASATSAACRMSVIALGAKTA